MRPRRIGGKRPAPGWLVLVVLILLALSRWKDIFPPGQGAPAPDLPAGSAPRAESRDSQVPESPAGETLTARVRRVVDGDTLLMENGDRVRLLGVDTPETKKEGVPVQPFGPEASAYTTRMVEGKTVRLEFDRERYDQFHRILAYVWVGDVLLNEEVIRQGFSTAQLQYPYRTDMKRRFSAAQEEARRAERGLWTLPQNQQRGR